MWQKVVYIPSDYERKNCGYIKIRVCQKACKIQIEIDGKIDACELKNDIMTLHLMEYVGRYQVLWKMELKDQITVVRECFMVDGLCGMALDYPYWNNPIQICGNQYVRPYMQKEERRQNQKEEQFNQLEEKTVEKIKDTIKDNIKDNIKETLDTANEVVQAAKTIEKERCTNHEEGIYEKMKKRYGCVHPFDNEIEAISFVPAELYRISEDIRTLEENSFLLHGYYQYKHILWIKGEKEDYIGVPGVFCKQEKVVAEMFGFPFFRAVRQQGRNTLRNSRLVGSFGYFLKPFSKIPL